TLESDGLILDLVSLSKRLLDPQNRWDPRYCFTGFWAADEERDWQPSNELGTFLESGPPPVVVTMGSMAMFDGTRLAGVVSEALRRLDLRGLLVGGWSDLSQVVPTDRLQVVQELPYDWLFPRAACVIHHGGCGTVAAVLRAGKLSVLLPQIACQEHLAK